MATEKTTTEKSQDKASQIHSDLACKELSKALDAKAIDSVRRAIRTKDATRDERNAFDARETLGKALAILGRSEADTLAIKRSKQILDTVQTEHDKAKQAEKDAKQAAKDSAKLAKNVEDLSKQFGKLDNETRNTYLAAFVATIEAEQAQPEQAQPAKPSKGKGKGKDKSDLASA